MSLEVSPPDSAEHVARENRSRSLDGLRGITIVLVMLGHAGNLLWPIDRLWQLEGVRGFFGGGAVGIFFIISGYVVGASLVRSAESDTLDPVRFYVRRLIRLGVQVVPLAIVIVLVNVIDTSDPSSLRSTLLSVSHMVAHTYNQFAATDLLATRSDLGHIWYLSVLQQVYLVVPLLLVLMLHRRKALTILLLELIVLSVWWRQRLLANEGWIEATVSTAARADAILIGLLLALHVGTLRRRIPEKVASTIAFGGLLAMASLLAVLQELPGDYHYLRGWGVAFTVVAGVTVAGLIAHQHPSRANEMLSGRALVGLGRASLVLFVWHLPVFAFVARHTSTWGWESRTIVALIVLAGLTFALTRWVEEPTRRWLKHHLVPDRHPRNHREATPA